MITDPAELRVIHYVVIPLLHISLCAITYGSPRRLSFGWVFLASWLVLVHAQAVEIFLNEFSSAEFLISVWVTPFLVIGTTTVLSLLLGGGSAHHPLADVVTSARDRAVSSTAPLFSVAVVLLVGIYVADIGVGNVALFFLIAEPGSAVDAMLLRLSGLTSNVSPLLTLVYSYSRALMLPLLASVATALFVSGMMRRFWWLVLMGGVAIFSLLTAAKAPFALTLVSCAIAAYLTRPESIRLSAVAPVVALALFLPALIYPLAVGAEGGDALLIAAEGLWRRVTYITSVSGAYYFDAYPALHEFAGASSNRLLAVLAGVPFEPTAEWIYERYMNANIPGGRANTAFYASFYADWGVWGILGGGTLVGTVIFTLQSFFDRAFSRDAVSIGFQAVALVATTQLMMTNFYSVALGRGLLSIPVLLAMLSIALPQHRASVPAERLLKGDVGRGST